MSRIERIKIFYEKNIVGRITIHDPPRIGFRYDPNWLKFERNFQLSVTLPLKTGEYNEDIITPWLANLLPEELQLTTLSRVLGLPVSNTLDILREIGGDTAGAISIGEPSDRRVWDYRTLLSYYKAKTQREALNLHFDDLKRKPLLVGEDGVRLSLAGGQIKTVLAVLDEAGKPKLGLPGRTDRLAIPKNGAPSTIIIKPDNPRLSGIVENEFYCLTLAKLIGIQVVDCMIIETNNRSALVVARFDRHQCDDGTIKRIHQEDFAQTNSIYPIQKFERGSVKGLDLNTLLLTGKHLPPTEELKLLDQVIFNLLVANTDAHAKNYSIILSDEPTLAPLYDVSSVLLWKDYINQYHAQNIAGKKRKPVKIARRHWIRIADQAGLNARNLRLRVQSLVDKMVAKRITATEIVTSQSKNSTNLVHHIAEIVETNALRIVGRL